MGSFSTPGYRSRVKPPFTCSNINPRLVYSSTEDVVSEEVILKWYKEGHSLKGKMLFLDQMKKFIEWLQNAEEESESGEDED